MGPTFSRFKYGGQDFFEVDKVRAKIFLVCEIEGLVVFFSNVKFPKTQPGYPVNFGRSLSILILDKDSVVSFILS